MTAEGGDKAAAIEKLIARVQLKTSMSKASVVNMPLADFVEVLMGKITPNDEGKSMGLIERLLVTGPDDAELTPKELAWLEAYLKQPANRPTLVDMKAEAERRPLPERAKRLAKLQLIRDFNRNLRASSPAASKAEPAAVAGQGELGEAAASTPKPKRSTERGEGGADSARQSITCAAERLHLKFGNNDLAGRRTFPHRRPESQ